MISTVIFGLTVCLLCTSRALGAGGSVRDKTFSRQKNADTISISKGTLKVRPTAKDEEEVIGCLSLVCFRPTRLVLVVVGGIV